MTDHNDVSTPCAAYAAMFERWEPLAHLRGGTLAMRAAGEQYLPREKGETDSEYRSRLKRAVLRGMTNSAIRKLTSRPFSKDITLGGSETLPEQLSGIEGDADREGTSLTQFAKALALDAWRFGKTHFLIDYPVVEGDRPVTRATERAQGIGPYFSMASALSLIGWRSSRRPGGATMLDQIRIKSDNFLPAANYADELEETVMVYTVQGGDVVWEKFSKRQSDKTYQRIDDGTLGSLTEIPLVTLYYARSAFMEAEPPLEDLAHHDIAHWQSTADQRNILRFARVPMLAMTGVDQKALESPTPIGASRTHKSTNPEAKFYYVEPSGEAIKAGEADLRHLEEIGEALGSAPMTQRSGNVVATAKAIDASNANSDAQAAIRALEAAIREGYEWAAEWIGETLSDEFSPDIYSEFDLTTGRAEDMKALEFDYAHQIITRRTFLAERRRRGVYTESLDVDQEIALAEADERPMAGVVAADDDEDDDFGAGIDTGEGGDDE